MGERIYTDVFPREAYSIFYQREATVIFQMARMSVSRDDCFQSSAKFKAIQCTKSDGHLCPLLGPIAEKEKKVKRKMDELKKGQNWGLV